MENKPIEIDILGAKVSLDRLLPPTNGIGSEPLCYDYMYRESDYDYDTLTPYACTFTYPVDHISLYDERMDVKPDISGIFRQELKRTLKSPSDQMVNIKKDIIQWIVGVKRALARLARDNRTIDAYLITFELTKKGIIHAQGLIYMDNMYYTAVRDIMALCWSQITGANHRAMMKKKSDFTDHAFDKCNNINSWVKYILKNKPFLAWEIYAQQLRYEIKNAYQLASYQRSMLYI